MYLLGLAGGALLAANAQGSPLSGSAELKANLARCEAVRGRVNCLPSMLAVLQATLATDDIAVVTSLARDAVAAARALPTRHSQRSLAHFYLAHAHQRDSRMADAEAEFRAAIASLHSTDSQSRAWAGIMQRDLALVIERRTRFDEAEALLKGSIELLGAELPPEHRALLGAQQAYARFLVRSGQIASAERIMRLVIQRTGRNSAVELDELASRHVSLAHILVVQNRHAEAEIEHRKGIELLEQIGQGQSVAAADSRFFLAQNLRFLRRFDEAANEIEKSQAILAASYPAGHLRLIYGVSLMAEIREGQRRFVEAEALYRQAFDRLSATLPPEDQNRLFATWALAAHLQRRGVAPSEARALFKAAGVASLKRSVRQSGFTASAQEELRSYQPVFLGQVRAAWDLSNSR